MVGVGNIATAELWDLMESIPMKGAKNVATGALLPEPPGRLATVTFTAGTWPGLGVMAEGRRS